jgi:hypothetical protein
MIRMAYWWVFRMGYTKRESGNPQTVYWFNRSGAPTPQMLQSDGEKPHYASLWQPVDASDPWGYSSGTTPDWLVGRYGNYWGAQWSGGTFRDFDGVGPTDCPYVDPLDQVALEHDIECWIAGEAKRNPKLSIRGGDMFRVENVYWQGRVGPREYKYETELTPHLHARPRVTALSRQYKERLKAALLLFTLLYTPVSADDLVNSSQSMQNLDAAGKLITLRPDWGCGVAIAGLGLTDVSVTLGDLMRILRNPKAQNIPLTSAEVAKIKQVITGLGRTDPIVRGMLNQLN